MDVMFWLVKMRNVGSAEEFGTMVTTFTPEPPPWVNKNDVEVSTFVPLLTGRLNCGAVSKGMLKPDVPAAIFDLKKNALRLPEFALV
jgi:hypothetical protein